MVHDISFVQRDDVALDGRHPDTPGAIGKHVCDSLLRQLRRSRPGFPAVAGQKEETAAGKKCPQFSESVTRNLPRAPAASKTIWRWGHFSEPAVLPLCKRIPH